MELIVLGSHATWPRAHGAASGYLVRDDGFTLWVDAGTGTLAKLQEHAEPFAVDAILVSHRHFDHFLDLYPYSFARRSNPEPLPKVPLFAPPGMFEHAMRIEDGLADTFDPRAVEPGLTFEAGPFRITTAAMKHPVPTMGMRIEAAGTVVAYSADTGPSEGLVELAAGAHLLLCEATWVRGGAGPPDLHLGADEAADHAKRAGAGRLVLTHIGPRNDRAEVWDVARASFDGDLTLAEEDLVVEL
jgi:ribonuclease BN (tRNA processing enzyme)